MWGGDIIAPVRDEIGSYFVDYLVDIFNGEGEWFVGVKCGLGCGACGIGGCFEGGDDGLRFIVGLARKAMFVNPAFSTPNMADRDSVLSTNRGGGRRYGSS